MRGGDKEKRREKKSQREVKKKGTIESAYEQAGGEKNERTVQHRGRKKKKNEKGDQKEKENERSNEIQKDGEREKEKRDREWDKDCAFTHVP